MEDFVREGWGSGIKGGVGAGIGVGIGCEWELYDQLYLGGNYKINCD